MEYSAQVFCDNFMIHFIIISAQIPFRLQVWNDMRVSKLQNCHFCLNHPISHASMMKTHLQLFSAQ